MIDINIKYVSGDYYCGLCEKRYDKIRYICSYRDYNRHPTEKELKIASAIHIDEYHTNEEMMQNE
jgi:hypothetical protein